MLRFAWLVMTASMAFLPIAAQEQEGEGAEAKPEEKVEVKEEEKAEKSTKPSEVDVEETVRVLMTNKLCNTIIEEVYDAG